MMLSIAVCSVVSLPASAAEPSESLIKANCQQSQSILNQIEKSDAVIRINRGRVYNDAQDLLYAMSARLTDNRVSIPNISTIMSDYDHALAEFRKNYNDYDDKLNDLIEMKCAEKPSDFYDQLKDLRDTRKTLGENVKKLDQLIKDYDQAITDHVEGRSPSQNADKDSDKDKDGNTKDDSKDGIKSTPSDKPQESADEK